MTISEQYRGAPMGNPKSAYGWPKEHCVLEVSPQEVDDGGYTPEGYYFGLGEPLWIVQDDGSFVEYIRAESIEEALSKVMEACSVATVKGGQQ